MLGTSVCVALDNRSPTCYSLSVARRKRHNPEKRAWRARSYKAGGRRVVELLEAQDAYLRRLEAGFNEAEALRNTRQEFDLDEAEETLLLEAVS